MSARERPDPAGTPRPLRADTARTVQAILEAAERVLSTQPTATMEQIADAAGVSRTTVHRRFATRETLIDALTTWAAQRFHQAVNSARPGTTPPAVALHQVTANVLRVKSDWGFAMDRTPPDDPEVARIHADVLGQCDRLFQRAQAAGLIHQDTDLEWARRVYYALIHEASAIRDEDHGDDADERAALVVDTLLRGIGPPGRA